MKVIKDKVENSQAFLTVEMEPSEMEAGMQDAYRRLSQRANIPGFRKGKAPRIVVERQLGRGRLLEEALDRMLPQAYEQALKEQEIDPYAQPELDITQTDPLIFKAVVPLKPTVELGDYKSIRLMPNPVDIKEENINSVIEELRHQHATWEPVDRPLTYNDLAVIDISGEVEDKPYVKKAAAQYPVIKETISPAPGFPDQIVGMKKEEEREFDLDFPADYPNKNVAGKKGHFQVTLHEVKEEKLPELNEDFLKQISAEFKTVEDLRQEAEKSLKLRGEENSRMDFEERIINAVIEKSKVEYPLVLVEMEVSRIINEQARQLQMSGRGMDDYLKMINKTVAQLQEELRPVATKNVTASLVLGKVAEAEKIEVTPEDIENGINNMVRSATEDRREGLRKLVDTPQARESLRQSLLTRKTIERLTDIAKTAEISENKDVVEKKTTARKKPKAAEKEPKEEKNNE